jgi:hypothetical protein
MFIECLSPVHAPHVNPKPTPDRNATIPEAQAVQKHIRDFSAFAAAHAPHSAATHVDNVEETLHQVAALQTWLQHYGDALRLRRR